MKRTPITITPTRSIPQSSIDLVFFHADPPQPISETHRSINYHHTLAFALTAIETKAPSARRIILSDETTQFSPELSAEILRRPFDPSLLMYERLLSQLDYLRSRPTGRATIFLDTDVLVNRNPSEVFSWNFDIGLTWRKDHSAPFNGGLIFVGPGSRGLAFLLQVQHCYSSLPNHFKAWWGDQFSLAVVAGYDAFRSRTTNGVEVAGARIAYLSCEEFNFTPEGPEEDVSGKFFLHFKGPRKYLIPHYLSEPSHV